MNDSRGVLRNVKTSRSVVLGLIVGVLLTMMMLFSNEGTGVQDASALAPCSQVQVVGLRGSTENYVGSQHGMGALLGPLANLIDDQVDGAASVGKYGLPYPASDATIGVLTGKYFESKEKGEGMLHEYLLEVIRKCPGSKIVVLGYSQGAHAAGDYLARVDSYVSDRIAAFVMFGDPRFNPAPNYTFGTFNSGNRGVAGARDGNDFKSWQSKVISFCNAEDPVCQGADKLLRGTGAHSPGVYLGNYGKIAASFVRRRLGLPSVPPPVTTPLDIAFVIDSTGSMGSSISQVASSAAQMARNLRSSRADFRVGLVDYKDTDQGDSYAARLDTQMTTDVDAFANSVNSLSAYGGGDAPEAVYSGMMKAINELEWRAVPRKAIIVMGDAPAKNPEPVTGFTETQVLNAARNLDPATVYPVSVGPPSQSFIDLAEGSGGTVFEAGSGSTVEDEILDAVDEAAVPLYSSLTVTSPARPGTEVSFSAAASYYELGEITGYKWDFDGDTVIDKTTTSPHTTHVYTAPYSGITSVTVVTDDGNERTTTALVDIRTDAPIRPGQPVGLTAMPRADGTSIDVAWGAPADLGGGDLLGYRVLIMDSTTGQAVAGIEIEAPASTVRFQSLAPGDYRISVAAVGAAGSSAESVVATTLGGAPNPGPGPGPSPEPDPEPEPNAACLSARATVAGLSAKLSKSKQQKTKLVRSKAKTLKAKKKKKLRVKKAQRKIKALKSKLSVARRRATDAC